MHFMHYVHYSNTLINSKDFYACNLHIYYYFLVNFIICLLSTQYNLQCLLSNNNFTLFKFFRFRKAAVNEKK